MTEPDEMESVDEASRMRPSHGHRPHKTRTHLSMRHYELASQVVSVPASPVAESPAHPCRRTENTTMSFNSVVGGKLKLKGKALDVRAGGIKKKKKRRDHTQEQKLHLLTGKGEEGNNVVSTEADPVSQSGDGDESKQKARPYDDHMTPAERRYHEQKAKLDARRLAKLATKSHRQRVEEFNQYLANLSEHYDIPKVGPG